MQLAKPKLDTVATTRAQALAFAEGGVSKTQERVTKIFHAPEGYKRLTINLREDIHKKIKMKAIEEDCTVTDIITKLLEKEVR